MKEKRNKKSLLLGGGLLTLLILTAVLAGAISAAPAEEAAAEIPAQAEGDWFWQTTNMRAHNVLPSNATGGNTSSHGAHCAACLLTICVWMPIRSSLLTGRRASRRLGRRMRVQRLSSTFHTPGI